MTASKQVHDIFEECLESIFDGGSIEDCLKRYPEHATELRQLLETSILTREALAVQPSAEFRERARQQLYAAQRERAERPIARRAFGWTWQPRWATALAAFLLAIVAGSGTVLASVNSMPDQPLYAVKHAAESARVALTPSKSAKAEIYASLADQRVKEIVYLADKGDATQLQRVTDDLNSYLDRIAELSGGVDRQLAAFSKYGGVMSEAAVPAPTSPPERALAPADGPASDTSGATLGAAENAPPPATVTQASPPALAPAPSVTVVLPPPAEAAPGAKAIAGAIAPVVVSNMPPSRAILKARISYQAIENTARLRAALERASPEAKPALLRAIAVSQSGYEKALQSLDSQP